MTAPSNSATDSKHARKCVPVDADRIGILTFAGFATERLALTPVSDDRTLLVIHDIGAAALGGPTNISAAIRMAARMLEPVPATVVKRILLIADGQANIEESVLMSTAAGLTSARIRLDAISVAGIEATAALRPLASATVGGQVWEAGSYDQLARAVIAAVPPEPSDRKRAATVICIDTSTSMQTKMADGNRRIVACQQAAFAFLATTRRLHVDTDR